MKLIDGVKYIFQIPMEWFKSVDTRVFGDHPGNGVKFEESNDGSKAIAVDFDVLDQRYASSSVKSVDGNLPNDQGDITLRTEGTLATYGSFPTTEVTQTAETLWTAGGDNGAEVLMLIQSVRASTITRFYGAKLTFSKDGILTKVEKVENLGCKIAG